MKIAISTLVTPGKKIGVGEYLANLIRYLQTIDSDNSYFIFTAPDTRHLFPVFAENFREVRTCVRQDSGRMSTLHTIAYLHTGFLFSCRKLEIDLIHIPNTQLTLWRFPGTIVTLHDLGEFHMRRYPPLRTLYRKTANRIQAKKAVAVITVSLSSASDIRRFLKISPHKIHVVYNGVSEIFYRKIPITEAKNFVRANYGVESDYILSIGSHKIHKNIPAIVRAFANVREKFPGNRKPLLVLVGKADNARGEIEKTIARHGVTDSVFFTGYVPDAHLPFFYAGAEVFVYPSLWEGFGLPVLEAMSAGCPVICSRIASLPEVSGNAALLVDPRKDDSIGDAVFKVLTNPDLRSKMIGNGLIRSRNFSLRRVAEQTLSIYRKVGLAAFEKEN